MQNEQVLSLDAFIANTGDFIDQLNKTRDSIILAENGNAVAVLQDVSEYRKLLDALSMLKLMVQGEKDIQTGRVKRQKDVFKNLNRMF